MLGRSADILCVKEYAAAAGKPMRLLVQTRRAGAEKLPLLPHADERLAAEPTSYGYPVALPNYTPGLPKRETSTQD